MLFAKLIFAEGEGEAADNIIGGPEHSTPALTMLSIKRIRFYALQSSLWKKLEK